MSEEMADGIVSALLRDGNLRAENAELKAKVRRLTEALRMIAKDWDKGINSDIHEYNVWIRDTALEALEDGE